MAVNRPTKFTEFCGQREAVSILRTAVEAAKVRKRTLGHVLLSGPPGLGKTTLGAHVLPAELGTTATYLNCAALEKVTDLTRTLTQLRPGSILFLDEIHALPGLANDHLLSAMEDFKLTVVIGEPPNHRAVTVELKPFTLVAATTTHGSLSAPLLDRFRLNARLTYYDDPDMSAVLNWTARSMDCTIDSEAAALLVPACQGTARKAVNLIDGCLDSGAAEYGVVCRSIDRHLASKTLERAGYRGGLTPEQQTYLARLRSDRSVSLATLSALTGESERTIVNVIEPWLLYRNLVIKTSAGRKLVSGE